MKKFNHIFFLLCITSVVLTSCKKETEEPDDPIIPNEEEVITTMIYTLTPALGGDDVVFSFQDLDGDGGNDAVISEGVLSANTAYSGSIQLLNELEDPAEDITLEVEEEGEEHQFFFMNTNDLMTVGYADMDASGNPIGIASAMLTNDANSGTLTITLRHEPAKDAEGVAAGDITNAGGETDIEVTFNVVVE